MKPDMRHRPLGAFIVSPDKPLRSLASRFTNALLTLTPIKHFMILQTTSLKQRVTEFDKQANKRSFRITTHGFDLKNFYMEIVIPTLITKIKRAFDMYAATYKTKCISIPKHKTSKLPPLPHSTNKHDYYHTHLDTLLDILVYCISNAYFTLGSHILQQILGLPMGCPTSPPLANLYISIDEHDSPIHNYSLSFYVPVLILLLRYMDDANILIATAPHHLWLHSRILNLIQHNLWDTKHRKLLAVPQPDTNFLDATFILYNNSQNVKIIYNNKNQSCISTNRQSVGRFHHFLAPSHIKHKLSAPHAIFIKIHDFSTFPHDMLQPCIALAHELRLLSYSNHHITRILTKTHKSRPHSIWPTVNSLITLPLDRP